MWGQETALNNKKKKKKKGRKETDKRAILAPMSLMEKDKKKNNLTVHVTCGKTS